MHIAIDFGTSFSQMATMYLDQPLVLLNPGEYGIPSEFYYDANCGILVGQEALDAGQGECAANLVSEVKMAIQQGKTFTLDDRIFTVQEIVHEICRAVFARALQIAKKYPINPTIDQVVISIPAKFGIKERRIIHDAAKKCLDNKPIPVRIIKEPVAAALGYYKTNLANNDHILVYDLGGGTCDIALVRADSSSMEHYTVVDSDMVRLGGRNWDEALINYISIQLEQQIGISIEGQPAYEEKIRRAAISVKHDLSDPTKNRSIARIEINGKVHMMPITQNVFNEITFHLLDQTLDCLQDVYSRNASTHAINEIICVGGSSNMLQVEAELKRRFPECSIKLHEPEHAVIHGAAVYAQMHPSLVTDVSSFAYGIDSYDPDTGRDVILNVIAKGSHLPVCGKQYFRPGKNQKAMRFNIYESEFAEEQYDFMEEDKLYIGSARLELPDDTTEELSVTCEFILNTDGLLEVKAYEPFGKSVNTSIRLEDI